MNTGDSDRFGGNTVKSWLFGVGGIIVRERCPPPMEMHGSSGGKSEGINGTNEENEILQEKLDYRR